MKKALSDALPLAIDWFQCNVFNPTDISPNYSPKYTIKKLSYGTRHFSIIEEIYLKQKRIATIARRPHSPIIKANTILLKFDNDFLYQERLSYHIKHFLNINNFSLNNISRIDIALDMNSFFNNLHPETFINNFINGKFLKLGKSKFKLSGTHHYHNRMEYLKFGTNTSDVSSYLYNKTNEMKEVKLKPWIVDNWKQKGLNIDNDVWRLEFSIKSSNMDSLNKDTGESNSINNLSILKESNLQIVFNALLNKYFTFLYNDGTQNKSRMKRIKLFNNIDSSLTILPMTNKTESTRADKIFIKKLSQLNDELRGTDFELSIASDSIFNNFVHSRGLSSWANHKGFFKSKSL